MLTYVLSFFVFLVALIGLSAGVLAGRGGIRGTCGGLNSPGRCGACGRVPTDQGECPRKASS